MQRVWVLETSDDSSSPDAAIRELKKCGFRTISVRKSETDDNLQAILNANPLGVLVIDSGGHILFANPIAAKLFKLPVEELIGSNSGISLPLPPSVELKIGDSQGGKVRTEATVQKITWQDREAWIIYLEDVSRLEEAEIERRDLVHSLRERVKELKSLYRITDLLWQQKELSNELMTKIARTLEQAMQYPEQTVVSVEYASFAGCSPHFTKGAWSIEETIQGREGQQGKIEVSYLELSTDEAEDPFLPEERELIHSVANKLRANFNRIQSENQLRQNEALLNMASKISGFGAWIVDLESNQHTWSDAAREIHEVAKGIKPPLEELFKFYPDNHGKRLSFVFNRCIADGQPFDEEFLFRTAKGREIWVRVMGEAARNESGKIVRVQGAIQDIDSKKQTELQIRLLANSIECLDDIVMITKADDIDKAGNEIVFVNSAFEKITGYKLTEVIGSNSSLMHGKNTSIESCERISKALKAGVSAREELIYYKKDGSPFWVDFSIQPVNDLNGETTHFISVHRDITEEKKRDENRLRSQRMESIGTLAGGIAHDLNNLLLPILMSAELLKHKSEDAQTRVMLGEIIKNTQRGADLVKQVLTFARGTSGEKVNIQIQSVIKEIEPIIRNTFPRNIDIVIHTENYLPEIIADATQIHQVIINLCVNARDAMRNGGTLTISVTPKNIDSQYSATNPEATPGDFLCIEVSDTGTGIPSEVKGRVFEPFFTTKALGEGTGLGLSTASGIIRSHGGFINVYSEPGKGTEFQVYLPIPTFESTEAIPNIPEKEPDFLYHNGDGRTILVVDDEKSIAATTQLTLETFGYNALIATNGADALAIFVEQQNAIKLVITDLMMPEMDGIALITALKQINKDIPIIATSGLRTNGHTTKAANLGVKQFIHKPFSVRELLQAIGSALKGRQ